MTKAEKAELKELIREVIKEMKLGTTNVVERVIDKSASSGGGFCQY